MRKKIINNQYKETSSIGKDAGCKIKLFIRSLQWQIILEIRADHSSLCVN